MRYGKFAIGALLCLGLGLALPMATSGAENTTSVSASSASASARITLRLAPGAQLRQTNDPGTGQLCLSRIPARSYSLSIRDLGGQVEAERHLPGKSGNHCVRVSASRKGKMVLIVAE